MLGSLVLAKSLRLCREVNKYCFLQLHRFLLKIFARVGHLGKVCG